MLYKMCKCFNTIHVCSHVQMFDSVCHLLFVTQLKDEMTKFIIITLNNDKFYFSYTYKNASNSIRAKFESLKNAPPSPTRERIQVNRFVVSSILHLTFAFAILFQFSIAVCPFRSMLNGSYV